MSNPAVHSPSSKIWLSTGAALRDVSRLVTDGSAAQHHLGRETWASVLLSSLLLVPPPQTGTSAHWPRASGPAGGPEDSAGPASSGGPPSWPSHTGLAPVPVEDAVGVRQETEGQSQGTKEWP